MRLNALRRERRSNAQLRRHCAAVRTAKRKLTMKRKGRLRLIGRPGAPASCVEIQYYAFGDRGAFFLDQA
ncbi:MAG: hypothetical protein AB7U61_09705, partial [Methylocystis sp.]